MDGALEGPAPRGQAAPRAPHTDHGGWQGGGELSGEKQRRGWCGLEALADAEAVLAQDENYATKPASPALRRESRTVCLCRDGSVKWCSISNCCRAVRMYHVICEPATLVPTSYLHLRHDSIRHHRSNGTMRLSRFALAVYKLRFDLPLKCTWCDAEMSKYSALRHQYLVHHSPLRMCTSTLSTSHRRPKA